jgi:hypothetical protein
VNATSRADVDRVTVPVVRLIQRQANSAPLHDRLPVLASAQVEPHVTPVEVRAKAILDKSDRRESETAIEMLRQVAGVQNDVANARVPPKLFDAPRRQIRPDASTVKIAPHHAPAEVSLSLRFDDCVATTSAEIVFVKCTPLEV